MVPILSNRTQRYRMEIAVTPSTWESWTTQWRRRVKDRLWRERRDHSVNQGEVAKRLGIPPSTFSYHLKDGEPLPLSTVEAVARLWPDEFADAPAQARRIQLGLSEFSGETEQIVSRLGVMRALVAEMRVISDESSRCVEQMEAIIAETEGLTNGGASNDSATSDSHSREHG